MCKIITFLNKIEDLAAAPSLTDWIQAACSVILVYAAFKALSTWKPQKKFELITELLAKSHIGIEFIKFLRLNRYVEQNKEVFEDFHKQLRDGKWRDAADRNQFRRQKYMEAKADRLSTMLTTVIEMRIKAEASFGQDDDFYRFFDEVVKLNNEVDYAYNMLHWVEEILRDGDLDHEEEDKRLTERDEYLKIIYVTADPRNDEILNRFLDMQKGLNTHRPKM